MACCAPALCGRALFFFSNAGKAGPPPRPQSCTRGGADLGSNGRSNGTPVGGGAGPPPGGKPPPPRRASVCTLLAFGAGPPPGEKRWPPHAPSRRHRRRGPPVLLYSGHGDGVGSQGVGCRAATAERFWAAAIHIFVTAVLARRGWRRHRGHRAAFAGALGPRGVGHSGFGVWQLTVAAACSAPDAL